MRLWFNRHILLEHKTLKTYGHYVIRLIWCYSFFIVVVLGHILGTKINGTTMKVFENKVIKHRRTVGKTRESAKVTKRRCPRLFIHIWLKNTIYKVYLYVSVYTGAFRTIQKRTKIENLYNNITYMHICLPLTLTGPLLWIVLKVHHSWNLSPGTLHNQCTL